MMQGMTAVATQPVLVAVSGGVDSVVLLDMLVQAQQPLIVAHVNHGIRIDSNEDETFIKQLAESYGAEFVTTRLKLGTDTSEDAARRARYAWLDEQQKITGASAIATAHHQDDVLETIVINLIRGTGWRGLCSLRSTVSRYRPLLSMSKAEIIAYALERNLEWREDSTNESFRYLRNRIRHDVIPRLTSERRHQLLGLYDSQRILRGLIDNESKNLTDSYSDKGAIKRYPLIMVPEDVSVELLRKWLGESLESARLLDLLVFAKTARSGALWSLDASRYVLADAHTLVVLSDRD